MSPIENAGKAIAGTVEALKTNPSCLAAIILAGMFAFLTYIGLQREAERSQMRVQTLAGLLERCLDDMPKRDSSGIEGNENGLGAYDSLRTGATVGSGAEQSLHWFLPVLPDRLRDVHWTARSTTK